VADRRLGGQSRKRVARLTSTSRFSGCAELYAGENGFCDAGLAHGLRQIRIGLFVLGLAGTGFVNGSLKGTTLQIGEKLRLKRALSQGATSVAPQAS